jgi:hypothetical protein
MYTAEPLLYESSCSKPELVTEKLKGINHQVLVKFWQN